MPHVHLALLPALLLQDPGPSGGASPGGVEPWTLEEIFGESRLRAELPRGVVWAPDGGSFLYRDEVEESTLLLEHDVATGRERTVVDWDALQEDLRERRPDREAPPMDDVNRTGRFAFDPELSPDGGRLVAALADDLFVLDVSTGEARFVTDDAAPEAFFRFVPGSGAVSFVREADLWTVDLATGEERRLTDRGGDETLLNAVADWVYEEELGLQRSYWWSPDGERVAYLQFDTSPVTLFPIVDDIERIAALERQRYPKTGDPNSRVRLGVLDVATGRTRWVASGDAPEAYLVDAGWVDDARLWYLWLNRDQTRLELRLVDESGTRTLVAEEDPRWVDVGPDPLFPGDGTFLWTSERDGWRHLYRYGLDGDLRARLTEGRWEVTSVDGLSDGGSAVVFSSTLAREVEGGDAGEEQARGLAIERHVWRVGLDGSDLRPLDGTSGWHSASVSPDGETWLDTWSAADFPTRVELARTSDGEILRTIDDGAIEGLERHALGTVRFALVEMEGGPPLWTRTVEPPDFDPTRPHPVVVFVYGGPGAQVVRNRWDGTRGLYQRYLAQEGLVVFSADNRGSGGRGRDFARLLYRRLGSLELEDQARGARWLRAQPWVDGERIGIYGGSYGGFMTLHCLLRAPELFRAGVAYAPVTDFRLYDTIYTERYMDTPAENPEGYREGAPLEYAAGLRDGALLLVHGTMDNNVHLQNTLQMVDRLAREGKDFDLMLYPRTRHAMRTAEYRLDFHRRSAEFLLDRLGTAERP